MVVCPSRVHSRTASGPLLERPQTPIAKWAEPCDTTVMKHSLALVLCGVLASAVSLSASSDPQEEKLVLAALDRMGQGIVKKDFAALNQVLHDDLTYGHATGRTETKAELLKDVANPKRVWEIFRFSKPVVQFYGSTAVVRSEADIRNGAPGDLHDGHFTYLVVLVKGPQGWQVMGAQRALRKQS